MFTARVFDCGRRPGTSFIFASGAISGGGHQSAADDPAVRALFRNEWYDRRALVAWNVLKAGYFSKACESQASELARKRNMTNATRSAQSSWASVLAHCDTAALAGSRRTAGINGNG